MCKSYADLKKKYALSIQKTCVLWYGLKLNNPQVEVWLVCKLYHQPEIWPQDCDYIETMEIK